MENIIINDKNKVKLIDFGFSVQVAEDSKLRIACGTPSYMSPEIVQKRDYNGFAADVWSLGILLYVMVTGTFPFKGASEKEIMNRIVVGQFIAPP